MHIHVYVTCMYPCMPTYRRTHPHTMSANVCVYLLAVYLPAYVQTGTLQ